MTDKRKLEPPLKLNMAFGEALSRFVAAKSCEVDYNVEQSKSKRPPQDAPPRRPGRSSDHRPEDTKQPSKKRS